MLKEQLDEIKELMVRVETNNKMMSRGAETRDTQQPLSVTYRSYNASEISELVTTSANSTSVSVNLSGV